MKQFLALLQMELLFLWRRPQETLTLLFFLAPAAGLFGLTLSPHLESDSAISWAVLGVLILLAQNLTTARVLDQDVREGVFEGFFQAPLAMEWVILAKLLVHWIKTFGPLMLAMPIVFLWLQLDFAFVPKITVALALGTMSLIALGFVGAALCIGTAQAMILAPLTVFPLQIPTLIFTLGSLQTDSWTPVYFLMALAFFTVPCACLVCRVALKQTLA